LGLTEVEQALEALNGQLFGCRVHHGFHAYHEVLYPKTAFGWLTLAPRFGVGLPARLQHRWRL